MGALREVGRFGSAPSHWTERWEDGGVAAQGTHLP